MGTADALRTIKDLIVTDFVVMSGDLITQFNPSCLLNTHHVHNAAVSVLLNMHTDDNKTTKSKCAVRDNLDYVGLDTSETRLLMIQPQSEIEGALKIPTSIIRKTNGFSLRTDLEDVHLYVFSHWVLDFLMDHREIASIKYELVPKLIRKQMNRSLPSSHPQSVSVASSSPIRHHTTEESPSPPLKSLSTTSTTTTTLPTSSSNQNLTVVTPTTFLSPRPISGVSQTSAGVSIPYSDSILSLPSLVSGISIEESTIKPSISNMITQNGYFCAAFIVEDVYMMRVNTISNYLEVNREITRGILKEHPPLFLTTQSAQSSSQVSLVKKIQMKWRILIEY